MFVQAYLDEYAGELLAHSGLEAVPTESKNAVIAAFAALLPRYETVGNLARNGRAIEFGHL